jgi:hypothetical protein
LRDPAKRTRLGMAARQLIEEEYSAARMAADYHDVYAEAILAVKKAGERRVESSTASQGNVR